MGCLVTFALGLLGLVLLFGLAVAAVVEAGPVALVALLAGVVLLAVVRSRRKQAAEQRRAREREERARRRAEQLGRYLPWLRGPITGESALPRRWATYADVARRSCRDYGAALETMRHGPLRERLAAEQSALNDGAEQVAELAQRAAELDRQLRAMPRTVRAAPEADRLTASIERARTMLQDRSGAMALIAAQAAQVAMSQSLAEADELVDSVRDLRSTVHGMAAALDEVAAQAPQPRPMEG